MKKTIVPILISAMVFGSVPAFAERLEAPLGSLEDIQIYSGIEINQTERNGETVYEILETAKEGSEEIYKASIEENNRRINKLWKENELTKIAQKKKINIDFEKANYGLVQFNCKLSDMTVEKLAKQLCHRVVKKEEKGHEHDWMYFEVTDKNGDSMLFRYCQECERWQSFQLA